MGEALHEPSQAALAGVRRDQPDSQQDAEGQHDQFVQEPKDRDEIRYRIDRAERIRRNRDRHDLCIPWTRGSRAAK